MTSADLNYIFWCGKYLIDIEEDTDACEVNGGPGNTCKTCIEFNQQRINLNSEAESGTPNN